MKRNMLKRTMAFLLAALLLIGAIPVYAQENNSTGNAVMYDAIKMAFPEGTDMVFREEYISPSLSRSTNAIEKVLIAEQETENPDETLVTMITPYALVNGELVNSYLQENKASQEPSTRLTSTFVDVTVTSQYSYKHTFNPYNTHNYYQTTSVYAYWSSSNSTVSVSNMYVTFEIFGDRYSSGALTTSSETAYLLQNDYVGSMSINRNNPTKGNHYSVAKALPSSNSYCRFTNFSGGHGLFTYIKLTYKVNGTQRTDDRSRYIVQ